MIAFVNGKFVDETEAVVSVFDRGFLYGDGLFEAMLVERGKPFAWDEHLERLTRGVAVLGMALPFSPGELHKIAAEVIKRNKMPRAILRLSLSRGVTARGYSPQGAVHPSLVMTLHPAPDVPVQVPRWRVITSSYRLLARDPLARFKTANKLTQVMARAEADRASANEALLLNSDGFVAEGATSNLFWIERGIVSTPPLVAGALAGVTRRLMFQLCAAKKLRLREKKIRRAALFRVDGAFLTMSSMGIVEIESLDGRKLKRSALVKELWCAYGVLLRPEKATKSSTTSSIASRPSASWK